MEIRRVIPLLSGRRKKSENDRIFIDLEELTSEMGIDDCDIVVKTIAMKRSSDLTVMADMVSRNWMIIVETSQFEEGENVRKDALKKMEAIVADRGGRFFEISDRVVLIAPLNVKVDRCRIRRKA